MSRAIYSHVLTSENTCINLAIHVLLMHSFCALHICILGHNNTWRINSNVHRNERNLVMSGWPKSLLWNRHFQNLRILHAFARHYSDTKMYFSECFSKVVKWQNYFAKITIKLGFLIHRGSYMSAHVLLNLLNKLGIRVKCKACRAFYLFFATSLINSIIQEHEC